jgi:hypothetical protein
MDRCFQLMEARHPALSDVWPESRSDLVSAEVFPVTASAEAAAGAGADTGETLQGVWYWRVQVLPPSAVASIT